MKKPHGMYMAPSNGHGGSASKKPTGSAFPAVSATSGNQNQEPVPIIIHSRFYYKLIALLILPVLGALSAFLSVYWKMDVHMVRKDIHPDIAIIETKNDAKMARGKLIRDIKKEVKLEIGTVRLEQRLHLQKVSDELKAQQKQSSTQILNEVRKTRRSIANHR